MEAQFASYPSRLNAISQSQGTNPALILADRTTEVTVTWSELNELTKRTVSLLHSRGVNERSVVILALSPSPEIFSVTFAAWTLGACVLPVPSHLNIGLRHFVIAAMENARETVVVGDWDVRQTKIITSSDLEEAKHFPISELEERIPQPGRAILSSGTTGRPKIIIDPRPWIGTYGTRSSSDDKEELLLVHGDLFHSGAHLNSFDGLYDGKTLLVLKKFEAMRSLELIEKYRPTYARFSPHQMEEILEVPGVGNRDISSLETVSHGHSPCPQWLKRAWMDLIGPAKCLEVYGSSERYMRTQITGDEWLRHPGSVGKISKDTDIKITSENGRILGPYESGEIFARRNDTKVPTFVYLYDFPAKMTADGHISIGDTGWIDNEGYLYLGDRLGNLFVSADRKIKPANIEAILKEHPAVSDAVVIGIPDVRIGHSIHAIIQPRKGHANVDDIESYCSSRLPAYMVPHTFEVMEKLPYNEVGKMNRAELIAERSLAMPIRENSSRSMNGTEQVKAKPQFNPQL